MLDFLRIRGVAGLLLLQANAALGAGDVATSQGVPNFSKAPALSPSHTSLLIVFVAVGLVAAALLAFVYFRDWRVNRLYHRRKPRREPPPAASPAAPAGPARETMIKRSLREGNRSTKAA